MNTRKLILIILTALYIISPLDLLPGVPVDDIIFLIFTVIRVSLPSDRRINGKGENESFIDKEDNDDENDGLL